MCDSNTDHASKFESRSQGIQFCGAKLQHAKFSTVGTKRQFGNIYNTDQYVWRSDIMVGGKFTVVYGRTVLNRNEELFVLIFPVL